MEDPWEGSKLPPDIRHYCVEEISTFLSDFICDNCRLGYEHAQQLISFGAVYVDGDREVEDRVVYEKQKIRVHLQPKRFPVSAETDFRQILHCVNKHAIILNKPSGIPVHATVDNRIENVMYNLENLMNQTLFVTHRLDTATEGLMVIGRTKDFQKSFNQYMRQGKVTKRYRVLTVGPPVNIGLLAHWMKPENRAPRTVSREAHEGWHLCQLMVDEVRLIGYARGRDRANKENHIYEHEVTLLTGRTHQIRAQFAAEGAYVYGDQMYGFDAELFPDIDEQSPSTRRAKFWDELYLEKNVHLTRTVSRSPVVTSYMEEEADKGSSGSEWSENGYGQEDADDPLGEQAAGEDLGIEEQGKPEAAEGVHEQETQEAAPVQVEGAEGTERGVEPYLFDPPIRGDFTSSRESSELRTPILSRESSEGMRVVPLNRAQSLEGSAGSILDGIAPAGGVVNAGDDWSSDDEDKKLEPEQGSSSQYQPPPAPKLGKKRSVEINIPVEASYRVETEDCDFLPSVEPSPMESDDEGPPPQTPGGGPAPSRQPKHHALGGYRKFGLQAFFLSFPSVTRISQHFKLEPDTCWWNSSENRLPWDRVDEDESVVVPRMNILRLDQCTEPALTSSD